MMLSGAQIKQLHQALLRVFPDVASLKFYVTTDIEESRPALPWGDNLNTIVFDLIEWAMAHDRVEDLFVKARYPGVGSARASDFVTPGLTNLSVHEASIQKYLRAFLMEIEGRLEEMLFLPVRETPSATESSARILQYLTLPPSLPNMRPQSSCHSHSRVFDNFSAAFETLGRRVLLLGAPGAGKTTTLLQFACTAANARLNSPESPIPIIISIRQWDQTIPLLQWAQTTILKSLRGVAFEYQRFLYLFDGLDELGGERPIDPRFPDGKQLNPRLMFLRAIEEELPEASVVISCREQEYQQIGEKAMLDGAVTLLPLEPAQIEHFLKSQNQSELWAVLSADMNLLELARTPLLLALLSRGIGEGRSIEALNNSQITAATIFDFYITQRFAHEASRRILPFEEEETRLWLNQCAARMWRKALSPDADLRISEVEALIGIQTHEFLMFARSMHFIHFFAAQSIQFIHLKFRDYCALPVLLDALKEEDEDARRDAADALGQIGMIVVPALIEFLTDLDADVRYHAAYALGNIGDPKAILPLIATLGDIDESVRYSGVDALEKIGGAAVPALIEALTNANCKMRRSAADSLGKIGDDRAVPALIQTLGDTDDDVRYHSTDALGKIKVAEAVPALIQTLMDTNDSVRQSAANSLGKIGVAAVPPLIETLKDTNDKLRYFAADILGEIRGAQAVSALVRALKDVDPDVRYRAADALGKIGEHKAVPALVKALEDPNNSVRESAANALGKIGDVRAVPALLRNFKNIDDADKGADDVRQSADNALSKIGVEAIPALIKALDDSDADVRYRVVCALGKMKDARVASVLIETLKDVDDGVRYRATEALGKIGATMAVPALIETLEDMNDSVRYCAVDSLGKIGDITAVPALIVALKDTDEEIRRSIDNALGKIGPAAIPELIKALQDPDVDIRYRVVYALRKIGDARVVPALVEILKDTDDGVRYRAAEALGKIGDARAIPALIEARHDMDANVRLNAIDSIERINRFQGKQW